VCGIAGSLGQLPLDPERSERILASLQHRGPDQSAAKEWDDATLLHTRLRIIDLSPAGDQPMGNEDGSVWTVFNGEIYNHHDLRAELEGKGHRFRGRSDTEVLPHLYEEHGAEMFSRLRGMFSVAILDRRERRLLLARDRFGIKPLFYAKGDGFVWFASEIAAVRRFPGIDLAIDPQAVADYASLLFVPAPRTIHRGIRALCPGHVLDCRLEAEERVRAETRAFHRFSMAPDEELSLDRAVEQAELLIEQAVMRQFESDVPLGALLSGGIDSSLVSLFGQRHAADGLLTFNVRTPDPASDETWAARAVAATIGSHHQTLDMDGSGGSWEHITALLRHAGQPFADTSLFAVDAVCRAMRRHVTVALSGDGGDEGFGGYDAYWQIGVIDRLRPAPVPLLRAAARMVDPLARAGIGPPTLARRLRDVAGADDVAILQTLFSWLRGREHEELLADPGGVEPTRRLFEPRWSDGSPPGSSRLDRLSAHAVEVNIRLILGNDFLAKVDAASMRHSLEVRVPLLDEDLIQFGLTLPHRLRVDGRRGKRILRRVAARHLTQAVVERSKQGFTVPVDRWVSPAAKDAIRESLLPASGPLTAHFHRAIYAPWVEAFCDGRPLPGISRAGLYQRVMMLLALDLTLRDVQPGT
jgi:asparagine synthase (glutamine-hydrolysing)